jgi:hypothetical protein
MAVGVFTDKKHRPTDAEIIKAIGPMLSIWQELVRFIREKYSTQEDFKFMYGKNYGWALRFRIKERFLVSLYPVECGFTAQVILKPEAVNKAQRVKLGKNVQQAIAQAYPYPKERWLFIAVESEKDSYDIQQLLELRVGIK